MLRDSAAAIGAYVAAHVPGVTPELAQADLDKCTALDAPITKLIKAPCPKGMHGFACDVRWEIKDQFVPRPARWLRHFNASRSAKVDCQKAFFDAFEQVLTTAHWEQEWDAQPYRIAATPPRTIGKMIHQLVTANYYHLTLGDGRPPLRSMPAPGSHFKRIGQPGFRWNVLDYGGGIREEIDYKRLTTMAGNVLSRPLSAGHRCAGVRAAWHCLWQRFPSQRVARSPAISTPIGQAATALYNMSLSGRRQGSLVQYLTVAGVTRVFTQPTPMVQGYISEHLRALCHVGGPYCGGSLEAQRTPIAAVHVRNGDSCDRRADTPGPWNAMWQPDPKRPGMLTREGVGRRCYSWKVYLDQLLTLQQLYGVRTVLLATDDPSGEIVKALKAERRFNWLYLEYPREQFRKRAWMEFRSDLDENAPFSLAAELELLSEGDLFVYAHHTPPLVATDHSWPHSTHTTNASDTGRSCVHLPRSLLHYLAALPPILAWLYARPRASEQPPLCSRV